MTTTSTNTPRAAPAPARLALQERDLRLLTDVLRQRVLTRAQVMALGHWRSVSPCNARLLLLSRAGLLRRIRPRLFGGAQALYGVGPGAVPLLAARLGRDPSDLRRQARADADPLFLEHAMRVTDIRATFVQAAKTAGMALAWRAEAECYHAYEWLEAGGIWRAEALRPDGYVRLGTPGKHFFIEADLGHVSAAAFARKAAGYGRYLAEGLFREAYGAEDFRVLAVTTGARRAINLLAAAEGAGCVRVRATTWEDMERDGPLAPIWSAAGGAGGLRASP